MTTVNKVISIINNGGSVTMEEPCNCEGRIAHNNGGNFHQIWKICRDIFDGGIHTIASKENPNNYWAKYDDTCELSPAEEWREISPQQAIEDIQHVIDNGWHIE